MSNIQNTVHQSLNDAGYGQYASYAGPVVTALEERENEIVTNLRRVATEKGLGEREVNGILEAVGLLEPEPEPEQGTFEVNVEASNGFEQTILDAINRLEQRVEAVVNAAARHGVTV